ncbi:MAG: hypothetical protein Q9208_006808 [Pyrenodesmia sp. 3 TL-2023]
MDPSTSSPKSGSPAKSSSKSRKKSRSPKKSRSRSPTKTESSFGSKAISKKEQLAYFEPMVTFRGINAIKEDSVPKLVSTFWKDYIVPVKDEQKSTLQDHLDTPMKTRTQVPESNHGRNLYNAQDAMAIHTLVTNIVQSAEENRGKSHEPHWVSTVVGPLITFLDTLPSMMTVQKKRRIKALNISSVSIQPRGLCPSSPEKLFGVLDRKIDQALAFDPSPDELMSLQRGGPKYRVEGEPSINQTYVFAFMLMFSFFEVKIAAEYEKRFREGYPMGLPIPAVAIYEDDWYLWIACAIIVPAAQRQKSGKAYRVQFMGPILIGSTYGHAGVYKIFHILKAVIMWGLKVYQPEYVEKVLAKYKSK